MSTSQCFDCGKDITAKKKYIHGDNSCCIDCSATQYANGERAGENTDEQRARLSTLLSDALLG